MKKILAPVLVFLFAALAAAFLPARAGAETAQYKVYLSPSTALNASGGTVGGVPYDLVGGANGYGEVFAALKTAISAYEIDPDGNPVIGGTPKEIRVFVSGEVSRSASPQKDLHFFSAAGSHIQGSNGRLARLFITSAPGDSGTLFMNALYNSSALFFLNNDVRLENVGIKTQITDQEKTIGQLQLGDRVTRCYIGEGVTVAAYSASGAKGNFLFWPGTSSANFDHKSDTDVTILSGEWTTVNMIASYRGYIDGSCRFTFGGTASCTYLAGWMSAGSTVSSTGTATCKNKYGPFCTDPYASPAVNGSKEITVDLSVNLTGGKITYYYGFLGTQAQFNGAVIHGDIETRFSGGVEITGVYAATGRGTVDGAVTNRIDGGVFDYFYGGAYSGETAETAGAVNGAVSNFVTAGAFHSFRGGGYLRSAQRGGVLTVIDAVPGELTVKNYCDLGGLGSVSGSVSREADGRVWTGAVVNIVNGLTATGVKTGSARYGFGGASASVTGDIVNYVKNSVFGDLYGSRSSNPMTGNVYNLFTDCTGADFFGFNESTLTGGIVNVFTRTDLAHFYGGTVSGGAVTGSIANTLTDCSVSAGYYGAGYCKTVGTQAAPSRVVNRIVGEDACLYANLYSGGVRNSDTTVYYCDFENHYENVLVTGNLTGGNFYGKVTGDISTEISGSATSIRNFYAAGLRLKENSVGGHVSAVIRGGVFTNAPSGRSTLNAEDGWTPASGALSYSLTYDLTDGDITLGAVSREGGVSVTLVGGSGTLDLSAVSKPFGFDSVSGAPKIRLGAVSHGRTYLILPPDRGREDLEILADGVLFLENGALTGVEPRPAGSVIVLRQEGDFALRYLYDENDLSRWEAATGETAAFSWSRGGAGFHPAEVSSVTYGSAVYRAFDVCGIAAKDIGTPVTVLSNAAPADEYSIAEACRKAISDGENEALVAFAKALLDYGKAAFDHFAPAGVSPSAAYYNAVSGAAPYADLSSSSGSASRVRVTGTSVLAKDALTLKFHLRILDPSLRASDLKARVNGETADLPFVKNGPVYTVSRRVPLARLGESVEFAVTDKNGVLLSNVYTDSVTSYCAAVIAGAGEPQASLVSLCRYLEEFVAAAEDLFSLGSSEPVPFPAISAPLTRTQVDAIPVATPDMTEEELRAICVQYMSLQQGVVWVADRTFTYPCDWAGAADENGNLTLYAGVRYSGMPYGGGSTDLQAFLDFYDEETGLVRVSENGDDSYLYFSNTCSTAAFWGWARVSSTQVLKGVAYFLPEYGYYPIGPYTFDTSIASFTEDNVTAAICAANGEQTMYESYAVMKPADGMVTKADGSTGHIRMAAASPVVVRKADGTIDGAKSYILVVEQVSPQNAIPTPDGDAWAIGNVNKKYTFSQLFKSNYLPFELAELSGRAEVQTAGVSLMNGADTLEKLFTDAVTSNFSVSRVKAVFTDGAGNEVYSCVGYGNTYGDSHSVKIEKVFTGSDLRLRLREGETYSLAFEVRLANGETLPLAFGAFTF